MGHRLARCGPKRRPWIDHVEVYTALARGVALPATAGDWTIHRKVSMGLIHGPRCTCLTRSKALDRDMEGDNGDAGLTSVADGTGAQWR
jgi:hypothetical protein